MIIKNDLFEKHYINFSLVIRQNSSQREGIIIMPRKGENIYKRQDGRWEGRYIKARDINNRAVYGYLYGKSYTEVKNKLKETKELKNTNNTKSILVEELIYEWIEYKKLNVKESSLARYKTIIDKHVIPLMGKCYCSGLTSDYIQKYMNSLLQTGFSSKTCNDILMIIKNIFKYATHKGIQHNCNLDIISIKNKKTDIETLTISEQKKLSCYLIDNIDNRNLGILISLYTGIRIGELCALKWSDIDMSEKILNINKTMIRIQDNLSENNISKTKVIITKPKSDDSIRKIPIPNFLFELMKKFKYKSNSFVLTGSNIDYIEPRNMQYYFKSVLKKCNLKDIKFHVLRHTFATRCIENGFEIKSLSEILGHSNIKITLDRYVHSSMDLKRQNMDKLNFLSA